MYSETQPSHEHRDEGVCLTCLVGRILNLFMENEIDPLTSLGLLDVARAQMLTAADIMLNGEVADEDEPEEEV